MAFVSETRSARETRHKQKCNLGTQIFFIAEVRNISTGENMLIREIIS
jgi:hypothetical protein